MVTPQETIWEIEPHTIAKHDILRRYLGAWFPILSSWSGRIIYIDGFCGPGRYSGGEPGSPIIALDVAINHRQAIDKEIIFWFIDFRQDRIDHLNKELKGMSIPGNFKVEVVCREFHEELEELLDHLEKSNLNIAPTFAFVDPFGFKGIPFSLIARLLRQPRWEAFITFMIDAINRFLEHPQDIVTRHIVDAFGTEESVCIAMEKGDRITNLRTLYQKQLKKVANFVRYFEMSDQRDKTIYYLFFASNHRLGHIKMKEAMWRVDPEGEFVFSDATDPNQPVLFELDSTPVLSEMLEREFEGEELVEGKLVREFVEDETPFLKKHMTATLRQLESSEKIRVEIIKTDRKRRRANTYPDEVLITFL